MYIRNLITMILFYFCRHNIIYFLLVWCLKFKSNNDPSDVIEYFLFCNQHTFCVWVHCARYTQTKILIDVLNCNTICKFKRIDFRNPIRIGNVDNCIVNMTDSNYVGDILVRFLKIIWESNILSWESHTQYNTIN